MTIHRPRPTRRSFLAGLLSCGLAAGCLRPLETLAATGNHRQTALFMGTFVTIDAVGVSAAHADDAMAAAFAEGRRLEALLTRHDAAAPLGVLNAQGRLSDVPGELRCVLDAAADMHAASHGAFDPTILPVLDALASGASEREAARLYGSVDYTRLERGHDLVLPAGMAVTLDGIAKGQVAQAMSDALYRHGVRDHLVNAGGDIVARGCPEKGRRWRVAVEDPAHRGRYPSVIELGDAAIATSGVYEQKVGAAGADHLVLPATRSWSETVSASVIAPAGARADALATAFSVMAPNDALRTAARLPGVSLCLVLASGRVRTSPGWPA